MNESFHSETGQLTLILGPMFSGKTTRLIQELVTLADVGLKVLHINHETDKRETEGSDLNVTTHHSSFKGISNKVDTISTYKLSNVDVSKYDVIGIDEGQFFSESVNGSSDLETQVRKWMYDLNKIVYVASLNGDSMMKPFGATKELLCMVSEIIFLKAKCTNCIKQTSPYKRLLMVDAPYSWKTTESITQKDVGGKDKYVALCLKCYKESSS